MHGTSALSYWLLALRWFPLFISDRDTTEDDPQTGKPPSTSNEKAVDTVRCLISLDARYPVEELAMFSWIKSSVVFTIIKQQLKLCKICARLVTHLLVSRSRTVDYVRQLLEKYEHFDQRRVHEIVTGDETCICFKKKTLYSKDNKVCISEDGDRPQVARGIMYALFLMRKDISPKFLHQNVLMLLDNLMPQKFCQSSWNMTMPIRALVPGCLLVAC